MSLLSMRLDVAELILNSRAVTTTISIAPCHNSSVRRYCSKSMVWGIYLLNTLELMLDCRAVTAKTRVSPCHHGSICQNSSKSTFRGRNLLNIVQLTLDSSAVAAKSWASPCHHGSICQDGSKGIVCCKNLLNSVQRILDCSAVATKLWISPGDNPVTSYTPQSKGALCCSYLWLLCNSSNAASISKPRILKKFCLIQKAPIRGSLRKRCPKACCAAIFRSATLPHCRTETVSHLSMLLSATGLAFHGRLSMVACPQRYCSAGFWIEVHEIHGCIVIIIIMLKDMNEIEGKRRWFISLNLICWIMKLMFFSIISGVILRKLWLFRNPGTAEQLHCSKSTSEIDRKGQETILLSGNSRFNFFLQANPKSFLSIIRDCQLYLVWNQWFGSPRCDLGTYCTVFISVDRRWESLGPALLKRMEHLDNVILICFHNVPYISQVFSRILDHLVAHPSL